jgi:(S)-ureidoglycine-glyoxylate aminotransferase
MAVADLALPTRLLAGGGPGSPHPSVLRALTTPVIGQFDPAFTVVMDEVMDMARAVFQTRNARCFAVSGLALAGLEALLNSLLQPGDAVALAGGPRFVAETADLARRNGANVTSLDDLGSETKLLVAPHVDADTGRVLPVRELAQRAHAAGAKLAVDATLGLGALDLPVDDWAIDACVAGADHCLGAPAGMALVTYTDALESAMQARREPPPTSYLDLLQLQAYWSPERLNHHTAPTSLVYGLREALRLLLAEGLAACFKRHQAVGAALRDGLSALGLEVSGDPPYAIARIDPSLDEPVLRGALLNDHAIYVRLAAPHAWRFGLLAADATPANARRVTLAVQDVLAR